MIALCLAVPLIIAVAALIRHEHAHAGEPDRFREYFQRQGKPAGRPGIGW